MAGRCPEQPCATGLTAPRGSCCSGCARATLPRSSAFPHLRATSSRSAEEEKWAMCTTVCKWSPWALHTQPRPHDACCYAAGTTRNGDSSQRRAASFEVCKARSIVMRKNSSLEARHWLLFLPTFMPPSDAKEDVFAPWEDLRPPVEAYSGNSVGHAGHARVGGRGRKSPAVSFGRDSQRGARVLQGNNEGSRAALLGCLGNTARGRAQARWATVWRPCHTGEALIVSEYARSLRCLLPAPTPHVVMLSAASWLSSWFWNT